MALEWGITKVKDVEACFHHDENGERAGLRPETEALIWYTMFTGIGWGITEDNAEELYARIALWERLFGSIWRDGEEYGVTTREMVLAHVGLWSNVSYEPRDEWLARMFHRWANENGAQIGRSEKTGVVTIKYDSTNEYNKWSVFHPDGSLYQRCQSQMEDESAKEDLEETLAEESEV